MFVSCPGASPRLGLHLPVAVCGCPDDRPRVPRIRADGAGPHHPGEEDDRGDRGAVRPAAGRRAPGAVGRRAQRRPRDLHRGVAATSGDRLLRPDVATRRSGWPARLSRCSPDEPRCTSCSLCATDGRALPGPTGPDGSPILLEDQDRRRWDLSAIRSGLAALSRHGVAVWARTACRLRSPPPTRRRPRSSRRTGTGSCCSRGLAGRPPHRFVTASTGWPRPAQHCGPYEIEDVPSHRHGIQDGDEPRATERAPGASRRAGGRWQGREDKTRGGGAVTSEMLAGGRRRRV